MKQNKIIWVVLEVIVLAIILLLGFTVLNTEYLFAWLAHNWAFYMLLGFIALSFLLLNKQYVSLCMTAGIITGIFIGNYLGRFIKGVNVSKIVEDMNTEEIYRLRHNPGFEIWIGIILIFIVIGSIIQITISKKHVNS
ncbi:hypothetical protein acsn021_20280 [Anaerocolumna cellulosilytica]|uniref:Uncharacterized protein n=1 Tax=Anaerocolumna cellulosilytica TaxID=433286 RepID=A0A6S6QZG5_9FIRM|nr:hypothetical protein [Anaerocolumna cellulosilytica]MBB5196419.1 putative integral membrane protein [Anaerocolumna cellulosilytica]BCJ94459.1 hypothetical protein acsn021_20280 [Anaerocolumna cellulosilytica]